MHTPGPNLPLIPSPSGRRIAIRVSTSAERALRQGHPWLFENAITKQSNQGKPGDLAVIFDSQRKFLAIGLYDPTSVIRVRILQLKKPATIDQSWFDEKIRAAAHIRAALPTNTNGYRLLHGENDHLPGLVIDRYAQSIVIKIYSLAWIPYLSILIIILENYLNPKRIILRLGRGVLRYPQYLYGLKDGILIYGVPIEEPVLFMENGITFEADIQFGQKTGFFLDQRDNRARVEKISIGRRVLNVFSYTGGFSIYAARGGAREVISVDLNKLALESAQRNFKYNQSDEVISACHHEIYVGDGFKVLNNFAQARQIFDLIIIDPPSFAMKETQIEKAIAAYRQLTHLGIAVLAPDGILVQASCSSRVKSEVFFDAIHQTAKLAGRPLRELQRTGHALDHPIGFPEGEYLKCLFATG